MVDLYVAEKNQASRLTQASLDVCAAGAGLLFLRAIGVRFEIGHLPVKTLLMSAGLAGLSGAAGREFCNSIKSGEKEKPWEGQNSNPFKLTTMVAFAVGALVLSQGERGRNLQYVGRVVSWMPPFASDNQMIATAAFSSISMCGFRYYFGSPTSSKKKTQLQLSPLPEKWTGLPIGSKVFVATAEKQLNALSMDVAAIVTLPDSQLKLLFNNHGDTFLLTLEQACAYNHAAKQYNQSKAVKEEKAEMFPLFYTDRVWKLGNLPKPALEI